MCGLLQKDLHMKRFPFKKMSEKRLKA